MAAWALIGILSGESIGVNPHQTSIQPTWPCVKRREVFLRFWLGCPCLGGARSIVSQFKVQGLASVTLTV